MSSSASTMTSANETPTIENKKKEINKVYHLSTAFNELHIGKFLGLSSAVYMVENCFYYPFDVVRTRLQVQREVVLDEMLTRSELMY